MQRTFGVLVLAFVVGGAPAALRACEIVCAVRDGSAPEAAGHSCDDTEPSDGLRIGSGVWICGHGEELPAAASQATPLSVLAVAVPAPPVPVSLGAPLQRLPVAVSSPPGHPRLPVPLRI